MRSIYEEKEKLIGGLLLGGLFCFLGGVAFMVFAWIVVGAWAWILGPILIALGILLALIGLAVGMVHNAKTPKGVARPREEGRVVARYAINDLGEMIFDAFDLDAPIARYYVRLQFLDGRRDEMQCQRSVFDQCGEGMRGLVYAQGGWLTQFTPLPDSPETKAAYRGW